MCNTVSNAVTNAFVTLPQRNATPDPTRPDPLVTSVCGCGDPVRIRKERKQGRIGFGAEA